MELRTSGSYAAVGADFGAMAAYSFMIFNLLCAPCFAAIGTIRRQMMSAKWTWAAIGYMCAFAPDGEHGQRRNDDEDDDGGEV